MKTPERPHHHISDRGLDLGRIRAITLDLDDTLWPIWPTIERAEEVLHSWLLREAPRTADLLVTPGVLRELREATERERSDLAHDLSALRRESIRAALRRAGEDPALADPAFDAFFAERQRVTLYEDALPALQWLSERYPLVAISNGNADVHLTGVGQWFRGAFSARAFGRGKPQAPIFHAAAAHIGLSLPAAANPMPMMLYANAQNRFCRMVRTVRRAKSNAATR